MTLVIGDSSISVDGFATARDADLQHGLGVGGEPIHDWAIDPTDVDSEVLRTATQTTGAVVMGRTLFNFVDGPHGWSEDLGYGARQAGTPPFFVVTSRAPRKVRLELDFRFVSDGPAEAISQAKQAAGDKDVVVMGGPLTVRSCLDLGLLDRLVLHVSPIVIGRGTALFVDSRRRELTQLSVVVSERATHITYATH